MAEVKLRPLSVRCWGTFLLAVCMQGCALMEREPAVVPSSEQRLSLNALAVWGLQGRVAVRTRQDAWQANLQWDHDPERDRLVLSGPLGRGAVRLLVEAGVVYITEADGRSRVVEQVDDLFERELGLPVPLSALRYWVLGIPEPGVGHETGLDAEGRVRSIRQRQWLIEYERFMNADDLVLPRKLVVNRDGLLLKLVVDKWRLMG